jgi:SAM-dependent methyltransferase
MSTTLKCVLQIDITVCVDSGPAFLKHLYCVCVQPWQALDVGCGSGRDAAFLASRGSWQVTLLDQSAPLLAKAAALCACYGPAHAASVIQADVSSDAAVIRVQRASEATGGFHLVHVARFLHKPLLPRLAHWVAPGGWVVYMAFADGAQHVGKCTPKNPKHLVYPGEMRAAFGPATGFIAPPFRDEIVPIEDGRPACDFVAQKAPLEDSGLDSV